MDEQPAEKKAKKQTHFLNNRLLICTHTHPDPLYKVISGLGARVSRPREPYQMYRDG